MPEQYAARLLREAAKEVAVEGVPHFLGMELRRSWLEGKLSDVEGLGSRALAWKRLQGRAS